MTADKRIVWKSLIASNRMGKGKGRSTTGTHRILTPGRCLLVRVRNHSQYIVLYACNPQLIIWTARGRSPLIGASLGSKNVRDTRVSKIRAEQIGIDGSVRNLPSDIIQIVTQRGEYGIESIPRRVDIQLSERVGSIRGVKGSYEDHPAHKNH